MYPVIRWSHQWCCTSWYTRKLVYKLVYTLQDEYIQQYFLLRCIHLSSMTPGLWSHPVCSWTGSTRCTNQLPWNFMGTVSDSVIQWVISSFKSSMQIIPSLVATCNHRCSNDRDLSSPWSRLSSMLYCKQANTYYLTLTWSADWIQRYIIVPWTCRWRQNRPPFWPQSSAAGHGPCELQSWSGTRGSSMQRCARECGKHGYFQRTWVHLEHSGTSCTIKHDD